MTEEIAAVAETPAQTEAEAMEALYDRLASGGISDDGEEPQGEAAEPQEAEAAPEVADVEEEAAEAPVTEAVEAPSDLPASLKDKWGEIPEAAREAVLADRRAMAGKMADLGRVATVARPVYDVILEAAKEIPTMQGMTPQAIAQDVFKMAKIQGQLAADPVRTLLGVAQQYGALDGMRQALAGQAPTAQGADVIFDDNSNFATNGETAYFLNTDYLMLKQHKEAQWTADAEKRPTNQDAVVIPFYWMGNLVCTNRALQGRLFDAE